VKQQYVAGALTLHQPQPVQVLTTREERAATIVVLEKHGDEFVVLKHVSSVIAQGFEELEAIRQWMQHIQSPSPVSAKA
jgi:hypothetical protein